MPHSVRLNAALAAAGDFRITTFEIRSIWSSSQGHIRDLGFLPATSKLLYLYILIGSVPERFMAMCVYECQQPHVAFARITKLLERVAVVRQTY